MWKIEYQILHTRKLYIRKILRCMLAYEKCKYQNKISKIKVQGKSIITNRI